MIHIVAMIIDGMTGAVGDLNKFVFWFSIIINLFNRVI